MQTIVRRLLAGSDDARSVDGRPASRPTEAVS
jgi:hypothetical protein